MNPNKEREWTLTECCTGKGENYKGCGKVLLLSVDDIFISKSNLQEFSYTFRCPHCGVFTSIPNWHLPKFVRRKAIEKFNLRSFSHTKV